MPLSLEDYDALGPKARAALLLRACEWRLDECYEIGDMVMEWWAAQQSALLWRAHMLRPNAPILAEERTMCVRQHVS